MFDVLTVYDQQSVTVLLADDSPIVRKCICSLLARDAGIDLVGEAASFRQTIQMAKALNPHVIVMDLYMPNEDQFTPKQIKSNLNQRSRLLAMSLRNDEEAESLAQSYGAALLLDKMDLACKLVPTIVKLGR